MIIILCCLLVIDIKVRVKTKYGEAAFGYCATCIWNELQALTLYPKLSCGLHLLELSYATSSVSYLNSLCIYCYFYLYF